MVPFLAIIRFLALFLEKEDSRMGQKLLLEESLNKLKSLFSRELLMKGFLSFCVWRELMEWKRGSDGAESIFRGNESRMRGSSIILLY